MVYHAGPEDDDETLDEEDVGVPSPAAGSPTAGSPTSGGSGSMRPAGGSTRPPALEGVDDVEEELEDVPPESRRKRLERILPELLKRAIEKGLETGIGHLTHSGEALRGVVNKVELPKEVAGYVLSQVDDTKNVMVRVVAREVREFLEAADLAKELQRALTSLSFEIRTEIRFIPNDAGGVTPNVKAHVGPGARRPSARRRGLRRPSAEGDDGDDG